MRGPVTVFGAVRIAVSALAFLLLGYLALTALKPELLPTRLRWFGGPASWPLIAIVVVVWTVLGVWTYRTRVADRAGAKPVAVIVGLLMTSIVLGFSSYWKCQDPTHPAFFTPLMWTANLVKGGIADLSMSGKVCPAPEDTTAALQVARLSALATIFIGVGSAVIALFRSQVDRFLVGFAKSVTAVVDIDDDAQSMVNAVAKTKDSRDTVVVITASADRPCVQESRTRGARIVEVDLDRPKALASLGLWCNLDKLYLLAPDPSTNLRRLGVISRRLSQLSDKRRLPLIVRIDDPWQAEAWRAQQLGGSDVRWAADAVGKYEVTAHRLLDEIIGASPIRRIVVGGTSHLTLALCADLAQRQLERDYYTAPGEPELPSLTLVADTAEEYLSDHLFRQQQLGLPANPQVQAVPEAPTVPVLIRVIDQADIDATAVIFVDADPISGAVVEATAGTRLAARFPTMPVYAWDPNAHATEDQVPIVGQLRTYRLAMDVPEGQAQDAWERAARLIHERYAAKAGHASAATVPWAQLDEFYRGSNRRQVRNALWMVEQIGNHTWNRWGSPVVRRSTSELQHLEPLEQLEQLGFERDAAIAMARAEHEDWCRYYRKAGWRYGPARDDAHKIHDKVVDWTVIQADPELLGTALASLAGTLLNLDALGYRSRPVWERFSRTGTVIARQHPEAWTWTSHSGETMQADAGDWEVRDSDGDSWSVRDDVFRATYEPVGAGRWRSRGLVMARPARLGETVETLEGPVTAAPGDWVVQGERGEQWPVPADRFSRRYQRVV